MSYERTSVNRPCTTRTTEYRHRTSSSCNSYEGGWFPSVPSRSGVAPTPDRKLDTVGKSTIAALSVVSVTYQVHHNALVNCTKTCQDTCDAARKDVAHSFATNGHGRSESN